MSTYYYLVCDDHKEYCNGASKLASGSSCHLINSESMLPSFIVSHSHCKIKIINEHDDELLSLKEWDKED